MAESDPYLDVVMNGTKEELDRFLAFFLHECPTSMIPTRQQVLQWVDALEKRGPEFASDAAACRLIVSDDGGLKSQD
ncbi:hypothetical protein NOV72_01425 [Caballeronia novacaledonica]|uniref:Uncharacterized protein n=1 Tax=Caballeronia novacaledonica TaxID=1544861 RepID=A0A2U3I227_9BURK|nr:hypothetical protein [Caballeronia novacaledonica]SPB14176.1 hypothetical protein NOV72_01425 [Caballeronia novacaledonica]